MPKQSKYVVLIALGTALSGSLGSAWAQPDAGAPTQGEALAQARQARELTRDWEALRREVGAGEVLDTQAAIERYRVFFDLFRAHKDVITGITLWGIDNEAVLRRHPLQGRLPSR